MPNQIALETVLSRLGELGRLAKQDAAMFSRWTIRKKLQMAMVVLGIVIAVLGYSSFCGVYSYKNLAATLSSRASEIPLTSELTREIDELRIVFDRSRNWSRSGEFDMQHDGIHQEDRDPFREQIQDVRTSLAKYKARLAPTEYEESFLADRTEELEQAGLITSLLNEIACRHEEGTTDLNRFVADLQAHDLAELSNLAHELPSLLTDRMTSFRDDVRTRYRTWIIMTWSSAILATFLLIGLISYARIAVVRPFKELLDGARRVADGDFGYRIHMHSFDELAELARAINLGAQSFLAIQSDLNEQVRQRSEEVIRNEQLASVGFLAAGVAHEINNPLASIAWSAEALETRLHKILHPVVSENTSSTSTPNGTGTQGTDVETLRTYLRRIQDEAFRCKGITERLLDFSRLGQAQRKQPTDLNDLVADVIDMVRHLGQYRSQRIELDPSPVPAIAWASPQEMKQVVLNLLTNALESLAPDNPESRVTIRLENIGTDSVRMTVDDNGCGMTEEVLKHLFEPFFTRRRDGRGTGLGLPITSRIIADHGGRITPKSNGLNRGSRFEVVLPSKPTNDSLYEHQQQLAAA